MKLPVRPSAVSTVRKARGYTRADLALALKSTQENVRDIESGTFVPTKSSVVKMADLFHVPISMFFSNAVSMPANIADFRSAGNRPVKLGKHGVKEIDRSSELQDILMEIIPQIGVSSFSTNIRLSETDDEEEASDLISTMLELQSTEFFLEADPLKKFKCVRAQIEKRKIFVIANSVGSETFRGFCLARRQAAPLIFVNTIGQTPKARLFTLAHELVHVFMRKDGVSDPFKADTRLEKFCNNVAARILMPEANFKICFHRWSDEKSPIALTRKISNELGISLHAIAIRIDELNLRPGFYSDWWNATAKIRLTPSRGFDPRLAEIDPDEEGDDAIRRSSSPRRVITKYGYRIPLILKKATTENILSEADIDRLLGIQGDVFAKAVEIATNEFGELA